MKLQVTIGGVNFHSEQDFDSEKQAFVFQNDMKLIKCSYFFQMNDCIEAWKHDTETKNIESKGYIVQSKFSYVVVFQIERSVGHLSYYYITSPDIGIPFQKKQTPCFQMCLLKKLNSVR